MTNRSELNTYIRELHERLRLGAWLRGALVLTGTALGVTLVLVLILNRFAFPARGVTGARVVMFAALAAAALFGMALPLVRATRAWAVGNAEARNPALDERLRTFEEHADTGDAFLELLAADTLQRTRTIDPSSLLPDQRLFALGGAGIACLGVLVWLIAARPGFLGYGASLIWTSTNTPPLYAISVTPGNVTVRRNSDQLITAHVSGMEPGRAQLFAHYQSASGWEPVTMQDGPSPGAGASYQFVFAGLPENVEYYVAAGPLVSPHYQVLVVDLPSVKEIHVTYHYPAWTGMKAVTEEHSGDLRAIEGTEAVLELEMDRPLTTGQLVLDSGQTIPLAAGPGNRYRGSIHLDQDGAYHVAQVDAGQLVRLSEDYFIASEKAEPPEVAIERPGGDYRASPIEEVTVGVKAQDPFGLQELHLHYSVNGGPTRDVSLLEGPGPKSSTGSYTLPLEDFKMLPGDLVSLYATARDGHSEARTDITFIQVDPFEREFSQSQQSGGGGGGGAGANNQTEISKREKELISATWKQQNDKTATPKDAAAAGQFLSDAQRKLRDQVMALSVRMNSRDISEANEEFTDFDKDIEAAAAAMAPSADKLKSMQWKEAIPLEQKALQALLRAEATFRKIQVAFGQAGGGGAGGGNAGRDLASLFDLELDTEKNQYETAQKVSPAEQRAKDVEDALAKLDALAKRQQELANQQHNPQQTFEERWQQEMLRREAEELERQMEQLAPNGQQGQNGAASAARDSARNGSRSSSGESARSPASRAQGSEFGEQRVEQALKRLQQATDAMKSAGGTQKDSRAAQRASEQLQQASKLLAGTQQQMASGKMDALAREADRLSREEHAEADRINKFAREPVVPADGKNLDSTMARLRERDRLAEERQQLSNDLSNLEKNMRDAAREMAPNQPGAAQKLRQALSEMDESDLDNHLQRTADWLRRGINPNANGTESEIAQGFEKLNQQLQEAQKGMGQEKPGEHGREPGDETAALDRVERLRSQLQAMSRARGGDNGTVAESGRDPRNPSGDVRDGGRGADGTVWDNVNTGNNRYGPTVPRPAGPGDASANPPDRERTFRQEMRELDELRQMVHNDPEAAREVAELAKQMRNLDPSRFPGNPALIDEMHREVLGSLDRLELELQRSGASAEARSGKSNVVPTGYEESVAEYYRRLSKNP